MARFFGRDKEENAEGDRPAAYQADGAEQPTREQPAREQAADDGYDRDHVYGQQPAQAQAQASQEPEREQTDASVKSEPRPEDDPEYKRRLEVSKREGNSDDEY